MQLLIIYINFLFRTLKEELQMAEKKDQETVAAYNAICEKANRTKFELNNVTMTVSKLKSAKSEYDKLINELKDKHDSNEGSSSDVFVSNQNCFLKYYRSYFLEQYSYNIIYSETKPRNWKRS